MKYIPLVFKLFSPKFFQTLLVFNKFLFKASAANENYVSCKTSSLSYFMSHVTYWTSMQVFAFEQLYLCTVLVSVNIVLNKFPALLERGHGILCSNRTCASNNLAFVTLNSSFFIKTVENDLLPYFIR